MALGKIERVNLREVWNNEATDFTPWLAQQENLDALSEVLGMDLETVAIEQFVGPFRADLLCKDVLAASPTATLPRLPVWCLASAEANSCCSLRLPIVMLTAKNATFSLSAQS